MADRKISQLTALTTPAAGDFLPIVDISEAANADKNKRITIEELMRGAPDGTAAAPSIAFESDPNTGIYSPGADQVAISTGGSQRLSISANGTLSTTSTTAATASFTGPANAYVDITDGTGIFRTQLSSNVPFIGAASNHAFVFTTNNTERVRIDTAGNVGIGTPSPGSILTVNDPGTGLQFTNAASGNYNIGLLGGTGSADAYVFNRANSPLIFGTNNTERVRIDSAGNVGIGTSNATTLLDVNADTMRLRTARTPASAGATGAVGEICWDADYIYICTATNTWKRAAISTW